MINKIIFVNDQWILPVILIAVVLLVVFIWKEWAQSGYRRILIKISLAFLAIGSLALIALKPAFPSTETTGKIALLTQGFDEDQLDSLKKEDRKLKVLEYTPEEPITDETGSAEEIYILGHGIKEYDLWQLDNSAVSFLGGNSPEGIIKLKFPQEKTVGDSLVLQGIFRNPPSRNWIVLQGPGGAGMDSIILDAEGDQEFKLAAMLKVPGNLIYSLAEKDPGGEVINSDPVPVKVAEKENLKILIINSFPTFETKYLKNFLAEAGHELVVRSQITRGRFKFEYFNTDRIAVGNLTEATLNSFDLLIIDALSWRSLGGGQATAVENSVRQKGLGVFIQPDDAFFRSPGKMANFEFERAHIGEISFPQWPGVKFSRFPYRIKEVMGLQKIITSGNSVLSAYRKFGAGRIGTTVLSDNWQLVLDGNTHTYRQLWSQMVEQVSKKEDASAEWEQETIITYPNEPFYFNLRYSIADPEIYTEGGNRIPMRQDRNISDLWKGITWPRESGWKELQLDTTSFYNYFVAQENEWSSLSAVKTRNSNKRYFTGNESVGSGKKSFEPLDLLWLYCLFLLCMGGLWLEPKV